MKKLFGLILGLLLIPSIVFAVGSSVGSIGSTAQLWRTTATGAYLIPTTNSAGTVRDIGALADRIPNGFFTNLDTTTLVLAGAVTGDVHVNDDSEVTFGNTFAAPDVRLGWNTAQTVDALYLGLSTAQNTFVIGELGDIAFDFAHGAATNPTLFIHSAAQDTTQWISLAHDQTNGVIAAGAGAFVIDAPSGVQLHDSSVSALTVTSDGTDATWTAAASDNIVIATTTAGNLTLNAAGATSQVILQNRTITPGAAFNAVDVTPTFVAEDFGHVALRLAPTQNGANSSSHTGLNVLMTKATGATVLDAMVGINIQAPSVAGTVSTGVGIDIADQTNAGFTSVAAIRTVGTGTSNAFSWGNSARQYGGGSNDISFMDSTDARGIDLTLTAAGAQTIAATAGNLSLDVVAGSAHVLNFAASPVLTLTDSADGSAAGSLLNFSHTRTDTAAATRQPFHSSITLTPGADSGTSMVGHTYQLNTTSGFDFTSANGQFAWRAIYFHNGAGTVTLATAANSGLALGAAGVISEGYAWMLNAPTTTGGVYTAVGGLVVRDQSLAGSTSSYGIQIDSQTANATTTRALRIAGTGANNAILLGDSPLIYSSGAEVIVFDDSTATDGITFTLTSGGNQTINTSAGNLALSAFGNVDATVDFAASADLRVNGTSSIFGNGTDTELTMSAGGAVTPVRSYHSVDTFSDGGTDDLDTITATNFTTGDILILRANNDARTVVVRHNGGGTGNIRLNGSASFSMDNTNDRLFLQFDGTNFLEIGSSNNGA